MDTPTLKRVVLEEMEVYTGEGLNDVAYLTVNDAAQIQGRRVVGAVLVVRVQDDQVVIELDLHDKLLVDALKARGVPEDRIILAYQNNTLAAS